MIYVTETHWRSFCASNNRSVRIVDSLSSTELTSDSEAVLLVGPANPQLPDDLRAGLTKLVSRFRGKVVLACCNGMTDEINSWAIPHVTAHDFGVNGRLSDFLRLLQP